MNVNGGPTLRLAGEYTIKACPECNGRGRIPCPKTYGNPSGPNAGNWQVSSDKPIPCPNCRGKKVVQS